MEPRPIAAPLIADFGEDDAVGAAGPDGLADADVGNGLEVLAGRDVANPQLKTLGPIVVDERRQQLSVRADFERAQPEVILALRFRGFVEQDLVGAAPHWLAPPGPILRAGSERPPVHRVAIAQR